MKTALKVSFPHPRILISRGIPRGTRGLCKNVPSAPFYACHHATGRRGRAAPGIIGFNRPRQPCAKPPRSAARAGHPHIELWRSRAYMYHCHGVCFKSIYPCDIYSMFRTCSVCSAVEKSMTYIVPHSKRGTVRNKCGTARFVPHFFSRRSRHTLARFWYVSYLNPGHVIPSRVGGNTSYHLAARNP